jgi:O-succinylbenzoic acid--CoA ligase
MRLEPVSGDDPHAVLRALRTALDGNGPALGLGMLAPAHGLVPSGTAVVVTTSGSTGIPKSVVLSRDALTASARATAARVGEGSWLLALPASYVAGLQVLVRAIVGGREPVIVDGAFSPRSFTEAALSMASRERRPAFTSLVPAQLSRLLDDAEHDADTARALRSFEAILIGGQALPPAVYDRAHDAGAHVVRTYGSTETSGGCVYDGTPLRGVEARIVDAEVQLSGPTLADGYLGDDELTDAMFPRDPDGTRWYRTGDAGIIEDGVLRVRGRIDNVIVSGGINISLDRVERAVQTVSGLEQAVVVGVPDERWGEASVIVVAGWGENDPALLAKARAVAAAEVGSPGRPSRLVRVDALPLLSSGKPDREEIRRALGG